MTNIEVPAGASVAFLRSYKTYIARITPVSGAIPTVTEIENTIGVVTVGGDEFSVTLDTNIDYDPLKLYMPVLSPGVLIPVRDINNPYSSVSGYVQYYHYSNAGKLTIGIDFMDASFEATPMLTLLGANPFCTPELRVYQ